MKITRTIAMAALVVLGLLTSQAAFADTVFALAPGLTAEADFWTTPNGQWSLTVTFARDSGTTATVNQFTLQLFQASNVSPPTFDINRATLPSGWGYAIDQKGNNGNSDCGSSQGKNKGWLCVTGGPTPVGGITSKYLVFSLEGTYDTSALDGDTLDLIANGTANGANWAISGSGSGVPEPASILLFGTGLSAVGLFVRRRLHR
jgi:hypothetical protein